MIEIANKRFTLPRKPGDDAIALKTEEYCHVHDCIIDLSACDLDSIDEAIGITLGAHGLVENCWIRGAGKLVLCGCGDDPEEVPEAARERGKVVTFKNCLLENFGRRGPEVQGGMSATLSHCVVRNWGVADRFTERAFGAWAHNGGHILAQHTVFEQHGKPNLWLRIRDHIGHIGQAFNDSGIKGLFSRDAWLSGYKRALTAGPDGKVEAHQCYGPGLVIDNHIAPMSENEAWALILRLEQMVSDLDARLKD